MMKILKILYPLFITTLILISCENNVMPLESQSISDENNVLGKRRDFQSEVFLDRQAIKFIDQAQDKIDKATEKTDNASTDVDITTVSVKITEAEAKLLEAQTFYDNDNFADAIISAKEAKELASEALDILEDLLEAVDDEEEEDDDNGSNDSADQALKFIDQAQDKIDKATEKTDKKDSPDIDLSMVYAKIAEADTKLQEARDAYNNGDYGDAIDLAKEAKDLASEALDLLEDILDDD